jgi:hypothetical protein
MPEVEVEMVFGVRLYLVVEMEIVDSRTSRRFEADLRWVLLALAHLEIDRGCASA